MLLTLVKVDLEVLCTVYFPVKVLVLDLVLAELGFIPPLRLCEPARECADYQCESEYTTLDVLCAHTWHTPAM